MQLMGPQLIAFMAIVEQRTVHAAATTLHLTQTAVTQRLKGLEQKLGVGLFVRSRRGMMLTAEGEALLRYCQATQALAGEAIAEIMGAHLKSTLPLAIAGPSSVMQSRVLPVAEQLIAQYNNVALEMIYHDNDETVQLLKTGKVQFAILSQEQVTKEMQTKLLVPERYVLVASADWKGRKLKEIIKHERIIDFNSADKITFTYLKYFSLFAEARHDRYFVNHPEAIATLVANGSGYSVLEKSFVASLLKSGDLILLNQAKVYINQISLAWYERPQMPPYLQSLIDRIL